MKNINTMTLKEYLWEHFFWGILSMIWFRCLIFRAVDSLTLIQSKALLWGILAVSIVSGIVMTYKARRNYTSLIITLALPYEAYALYTYWNVLTWQFYVSVGIAIFLSVTYIYLILSQRITNIKMKKFIVRKRTKKCFLGVRAIASFCFLIVVVSVATSSLFGVSLTKSKVSADVNQNQETWTIANNIDYVAMFYKETWNELSVEDKTTAMQVIANIECRYLGLPHELTLIIACLPEDTLASYEDRTHTIRVNLDHFEDADPLEIIDSICHEAYHAYQHRLVDVYDSLNSEYKNMLVFYNASIYKEEFASYTDGHDDYLGYYFQSCERNARSYASDAVEEYQEYINDYIGLSDQECKE